MLRRFTNTFVPGWTATCASRRVPRSHAGHAVEVTNLTAAYGRMPVLWNIDLAIAQGESVAVIGPNGTGKSTLLKCLAGAVRPTAGNVRWFGEATSCRALVRRKIGFVGQECGLYAELTALENLLFAGRMNGISDVRDRAAALLAEGGLAQQAHRLAGQLSHGMRQRLAILRTLIHEPQLVLLDEPSSGLDSAGRQWLERLFQRWRRAGQSVCFASHDAAESRNLADRVVHLEAGRIAGIERGNYSPITLRRSA